MENQEEIIEVLEKKITGLQKQISFKREMLKEEMESENELLIESLQNEIVQLKESIVVAQAELRKHFLKLGNKRLEKINNKNQSIKYS